MLRKEQLIQWVLRWFAERILRKYKPMVIGITGSVGKSTTKEMIFTALENYFRVRKSDKNYNNEIGVPLAIIGVNGDKKNIWQWLRVVIKSICLLIFPYQYPDVLVLELAADQVGDIKYFCKFIPIDIGVVTNVGISHLEKFKTKENIFKEKTYLLKQAKKLALYNGDNIQGEDLKREISGKVETFGFDEGLTWRVLDVKYSYTSDGLVKGISFKVQHKQKIFSGQLNNVVGYPYLLGLIPALAVANYLKISLTEILRSLQNFSSISGHLSLRKGLKNVAVIDDTYNSAPSSVAEALKVVKNIKAKRKIVVLGDMLELGKMEKKAHRLVGEKVAMVGEDVFFVAVGERMKLAQSSFQKKIKRINFGNYQVKWFDNSIQAGEFLKKHIQSGDVVLVKGSRGMKMEEVVERLVGD